VERYTILMRGEPQRMQVAGFFFAEPVLSHRNKFQLTHGFSSRAVGLKVNNARNEHFAFAFGV
jgi:hypothetical protein